MHIEGGMVPALALGGPPWSLIPRGINFIPVAGSRVVVCVSMCLCYMLRYRVLSKGTFFKNPLWCSGCFHFQAIPFFLVLPSQLLFSFQLRPSGRATQTALSCSWRGHYRHTSQDDRPAGGAHVPLVFLFLPLSQQRFCISALPQPPALRPISACLARYSAWPGSDDLVNGTLQRTHRSLGPQPYNLEWWTHFCHLPVKVKLEPVCLPPTAAELRHLYTGPRESACQPSPRRRAEVTREATKRRANISKDAQGWQGSLSFLKVRGKKPPYNLCSRT